MIIAPIIFCTVVSGIAHVSDAAKVGRVALKAILYFEVISTLALLIGLLVAEVIQPGRGMKAVPRPGGAGGRVEAVWERKQAEHHTTLDFVMGIVPKTVVSAFVDGEILQVLFFSVIFGFALIGAEKVDILHNLIDQVAHGMFAVVKIIMKFAPFGAFGAMAHTVGKYGIKTLGSLLGLVATNYLTSLFFVICVLGVVCLIARFNIFRFLYYLKHELLLVLATSSSESALPSLMQKLQAAGLSKPVVGLVVPLGYSFNLDGTNIYMTLTTLFISQVMGVDLTWGDKIKVLAVAMLTSKGAAGVSGAGFITLAATLSSIHPELVPGMAIVLGIDKFMSECRSLTNICGNAVAAVVIAAMEGELNREKFHNALHGKVVESSSV
ncbi:C4-dicarboxylate transport protein 2 [Durusdinium trenchii]|uniref:Amino acid transporter n=1 Tax=Durusdinium trenchii TaxID=1381693 RepID=A0ABP0SNM9_9DINO